MPTQHEMQKYLIPSAQGLQQSAPRVSRSSGMRGSATPLEYPYPGSWGTTYQQLEQNPDLHPIRKWDTYWRMSRQVPIITAFIGLFSSLIAQTKFSVHEASDEEEARINRMLGELLSPESITKLAEGLLYGFSLVEWTGEVVDGEFVIISATPILQKHIVRTGFDKNWDPVVFYHSVIGGYAESLEIPTWKTAYSHVGKPPYGDGLFAGLAKPALEYLQNRKLVHKAAELNLRNISNFKAPLTAPENTDDDSPDNVLIRDLEGIVSNKNSMSPRVVLDSRREINTDNTTDTEKVVGSAPLWEEIPYKPTDVEKNDRTKQYTDEMSVILGMEAFRLGQTGVGSFSLAETQVDAFTNNVRGGARLVADALSRVLQTMYTLNGLGDAPEIQFDKTEFHSPADLSQLLVNLSNATQQKFDLESMQVKELLARAGLPTEVLKADPPPTPPNPFTPPAEGEEE